jgi:Transglutaminase-like superfamily
VRADSVAYRLSSCPTVHLVTMSAPLYFLPRHIFLCPMTRHCVILDISRDKYICIQREAFDLLRPQLQGYSQSPSTRPTTGDRDEAVESLVSELLANGLLTETEPQGTKGACSEDIVAANTVLAVQSRGPGPMHLATNTLAFFRACITTDRRLQQQTFQDIVGTVGRRKRCYAPKARIPTIQTLSRLVETFSALRLFYPRAYLCMFDSLALLEFLASHRIYPDWVFGVNADPFQAHCWLQAGDLLLNDTLERTAIFRPIMSV